MLRLTMKELVALMTTKGTATTPVFGDDWFLTAVEREDGSGKSFNLVMVSKFGTTRRVYCRIIEETPTKLVKNDGWMTATRTFKS